MIKSEAELHQWVESNYDKIDGKSDQDKVLEGYKLATSDLLSSRLFGMLCWFRTCRFENTQQWRSGTLRAWSTSHDVFESGPGHFPVGVVEDMATRHCLSVPVDDICFAEKSPSGSGVCHCGLPMDEHSVMRGHSPVEM